MQSIISNLNYKSEPIQAHRCDCKKRFWTFFAEVFDEDGDDVAMCFCKLSHLGENRVAQLAILLSDDESDEDVMPAFTLALWMNGDNVATAVIDSDVEVGTVLPPPLTRDEALASPLLPLIFEIDDFILNSDKNIRRYLSGEWSPATRKADTNKRRKRKDKRNRRKPS